jgi:FKBP-type peptidyl-prolyl cis-trans isomerase
MNKISMILLSALSVTGVASAQGGKTPVKPAAKPVAPVLKNLEDSANYAIGYSVAAFYKQQGMKKINSALVTKAINDVMGGKKTLLDEASVNNVMNSYMTELQANKSKPRVDSGLTYLAQNAKRPGVKTTASGLQYEMIRSGNGVKPTAADSVTCNYRGTFINGVGFDNSYDRGQPVTFPLTGVIKGWTEGLQLMDEGSKYKLYVPYMLGYGASDYGPIPGGSVLVFEIELLEVKKGK